MMPLISRPGRLFPLVAFVVVFAVMASALAGVALGDTTTTVPLDTGSQTTSFTVSAVDLGVQAGVAPKIQSPSAIVVHAGTGKVLYEWDAYERRPMASTTKIMTATLILEQMSLSTSVTISENAAKTIEVKPWLKTGDVLTVEQLMYSLLVHSANSAATALAEACSGDVESFVAQMNEKAAELGMEDTQFKNPSGLDKDGHYSTAADLAVLARYAMKNEVFRKMVSTREYTLSLPGRSQPLVFENTNKLLQRTDWVIGIKTGLTPRAEQCLVGAATQDGVSVISVLLGQPSSKVCWDESEALLEYGLSQYRHVTLLDEGEVVAEAEVPYHVDDTVQIVTESAVEMELYKDDSVTTTVVLERPLALPVDAGESFGEVRLTVDGEVIETVDLVATQSFEQTTLGTKIRYFFGRIGRLFGG